MDPGFPTCWGCVFVIMAKNANWATMLIFNIFKKTFLIIFLMQPNSLNSWNNTYHEMFLPQSKLLTLTIQYLIYFAYITTSLCIYKLVSFSFLCLISLRSLFLFFSFLFFLPLFLLCLSLQILRVFKLFRHF